jgi:hypothetical protein
LTYPYAHGCSPDPKGRWDKYWKYENDDPSIAYYGTIVASELLAEIEDRISKRSKDIYHVRPEAIIAQDFRHEVFRKLQQMVNESVEEIEQYERENSGDIRNHFDSEEEEEE